VSSPNPPFEEHTQASALLATTRAALASRYEIFEVVGEGANAFVLRGRERSRGRDVALKILKPELAQTLARTRFQNEIARIAKLMHPCILPVLDSGEVGDTLFYTMPLVQGESLRVRLTAAGPLPLDEVLRIGIDLCDALAYAHARGIVHRDLKPENVLMAGSRAILADFGHAAVTKAALGANDPRLTSEGMVIGTPAYLSPEQAAGGAEPTPRSDLYSLGCVLFELLTAQTPFTGASAQSLFAKHISAPVPSLTHDRPGLPDEIERLVRRLLSKSPADRPASADETRGELARILARGEKPGRPSRYLSRSMLAWVAGASVVMVLATWLLASMDRDGKAIPARPTDLTQIAVAPFDDLTPSSAYGWLAHGLSIELIEALSTVQALEVRSFEAVRAARLANVTLDSLRRALRVGTLVSGGLERLGNRLRLSVQITDLNTSNTIGRTVHAEADSGRADSLRFAMVARVAAELRSALGTRLTELRGPERRLPSRSWEAYRRAERLRLRVADDIANGRGRVALGAMDAADSSYEIAIATAPGWQAPLIGRGWLYEYRARFISDTTRNVCTDECIAWRRRAIALAQRVSASRRDTIDAMELRGTVRLQLSRAPALGDSAETLVASAERDLTGVTSTDPQRARSWIALSTLYSRAGEWQRSVDALQRAEEADPWLAMAPEVLERSLTDHRAIGALDEAARRCELGLARYPERVNFHQCRLIMLGERGRGPSDIARAWSEFERTIAAIADTSADVTWWFRRAMVAAVIARSGLRDSAYAVLRASRAQRPTSDPNLLYQEAIVYSVAGDTARGVETLARYLDQRTADVRLVRRERRFESIRNTAPFDSMLRGIENKFRPASR